MQPDDSLFLKQLDHIQAIIQRLAANSFLLKGWAVTIVSSLIALSIKDGKFVSNIALISIIPVLCFLLMDAYYLALERSFRAKYNTALEGRAVALLDHPLKREAFLAAIFTWPTAGLYGTLLAIVLSTSILR